MELVSTRKFDVDYYEKDANTWKIISHLADEEHDITVDLDISVPEVIIQNIAIRFDRCPLDQCSLIEEKGSQLIGMNVLEDYKKNACDLFMGPAGCPNVFNLLNIAVPGIAYIYYPHLLKTGAMKLAEWVNIIRTNFANDCLAHVVLNER